MGVEPNALSSNEWCAIQVGLHGCSVPPLCLLLSERRTNAISDDGDARGGSCHWAGSLGPAGVGPFLKEAGHMWFASVEMGMSVARWGWWSRGAELRRQNKAEKRVMTCYVTGWPVDVCSRKAPGMPEASATEGWVTAPAAWGLPVSGHLDHVWWTLAPWTAPKFQLHRCSVFVPSFRRDAMITAKVKEQVYNTFQTSRPTALVGAKNRRTAQARDAFPCLCLKKFRLVSRSGISDLLTCVLSFFCLCCWMLAWWPGDEDGKRDRRIRRGEGPGLGEGLCPVFAFFW